MPIFSYKTINKEGKTIEDTIDAESENIAITSLLKKGMSPISIEDINSVSQKLAPLEIMASSPSDEDILFFIRNFSIALQSGVTVVSALDIMEQDSSRKSMRDMIIKVSASVRGGTSLSDSFMPFSKYFTPAFVGLLRAGEISGTLGKAFNLIGEYLKREFSLKQKLKSALIYPVVLVVSSLSVVGLLMIFVLPKLSGAFAQSGVKLPLITQIVLAISNIFTYSLWLDLLFVLVFIALFLLATKTKAGSDRLNKIIEVAPISGKMMRSVAVVRFLRTLGNLLQAGVSIIESLRVTADSVGHLGMKSAILSMCDDVEGGGQLSKSMENYPKYFSGVIIGLVRVGEETGNLGSILIEVSEFFDDELDYNLKNAMALLEPLLLLAMGIVVGVIALSVLLPIYQLVSKLA
jgi:type II secretory pathway component PulF